MRTVRLSALLAVAAALAATAAAGLSGIGDARAAAVKPAISVPPAEYRPSAALDESGDGAAGPRRRASRRVELAAPSTTERAILEGQEQAQRREARRPGESGQEPAAGHRLSAHVAGRRAHDRALRSDLAHARRRQPCGAHRDQLARRRRASGCARAAKRASRSRRSSSPATARVPKSSARIR